MAATELDAQMLQRDSLVFDLAGVRYDFNPHSPGNRTRTLVGQPVFSSTPTVTAFGRQAAWSRFIVDARLG
jgi:hypothetical protein